MAAILITGGSSGIGLCCLRELAKASPNTIIISASRVRLTLCSSFSRLTGCALKTAPPELLPFNVRHLGLDLSSRKSVQSLVRTWSYGPLAALICNAGMAPGLDKPTYDSDGVELCFAVNYLNQALLFFLLKEKDLLAHPCRLVFLPTALHDPKQPLNQSPAFWPDTETVARAFVKDLSPRLVRYSTAKLGTIFFAYALDAKLQAAAAAAKVAKAPLPDREWTVLAYEPGFIPSGGSRLQRGEYWVVG